MKNIPYSVSRCNNILWALLVFALFSGCGGTTPVVVVMHSWYGKSVKELKRKWPNPEVSPDGELYVYTEEKVVPLKDSRNAKDNETGTKYVGAESDPITIKIENRFYVDRDGKIIRWEIVKTPVYSE